MPNRGKTCDAISGILDEGKEVTEEFSDSPALDAGLAGAQAVEHYEMSRFGTLKARAIKLGMNNAVHLLDETLQQEKKADQLLSQIAEKAVNAESVS
jgi:ferritin-like metal-binding protein YciE